MDIQNYPLGHTPNEIGRLDVQAGLLQDPLLLDLAKGAKRVLEIGAGVGSNWPLLQAANPLLAYIGVDFSAQAVDHARRAHVGSDAQFETMDATNLKFTDGQFDLVFSKLVLWSIGPSWKKAVTEARRVLKPGGIFYAFEPFDRGVLFEPAKPKMSSLIRLWDDAALRAGLNPLIGPTVPMAMRDVGFTQVQTKAFPVLALGHDRARYLAICDNLRKFYGGDFAGNPAENIDVSLKTAAFRELSARHDQGLVMDFFFVTWGLR